MEFAVALAIVVAFICFMLSARRKAPKGTPGGNDIQFNWHAALLGGLIAFVLLLAIGKILQPVRKHARPFDFYTRDIPDTPDAVGVRGHFRESGTHIEPHMRSREDGIFENNWSTSGNVNPYTGKTGTRRSP